MKMINKLIVPVTASALLLGACGASATDSKENTLI
ncbi:peptidylprolyl isomerase, partial [Staphylococcus aureus]